MKLFDITLKNFRNFEEYSVTLGKKTTVFIGRNGMGKTNLIESMVQSLSFIFSKQRDTQQYEFIRSTDQGVKRFKDTDPRYANRNYTYPLAIEVNGGISMGNDIIEPIKWSFEQESKKSGLKDSKYREAYHSFWDHYNTLNEKPVLAFFSDGFPHEDTRLSKGMKDKLKSGNPLPSCDGYYQWDKEQNCVNIWKKYFIQQWLNNRLSNESNPEMADFVRAINSKLHEFSLPMSGTAYDNIINELVVEYREEEATLLISFEDGTIKPFETLPAGYLRIYSIVLDLTSRSYLLNKSTNPEGIVFIDEIDLHLHPSLAAEILPRLQRSFPRIQFIVSTHSPMVISNISVFSDNEIIALRKTDGRYFNTVINDQFGLNYDLVLSAVMDAEPNNIRLQQLKEKYKRLMRRGKKETAQLTLNDIGAMLSEDRFKQIKEELSKQLVEEV